VGGVWCRVSRRTDIFGLPAKDCAEIRAEGEPCAGDLQVSPRGTTRSRLVQRHASRARSESWSASLWSTAAADIPIRRPGQVCIGWHPSWKVNVAGKSLRAQARVSLACVSQPAVASSKIKSAVRARSTDSSYGLSAQGNAGRRRSGLSKSARLRPINTICHRRPAARADLQSPGACLAG